MSKKQIQKEILDLTKLLISHESTEKNLQKRILCLNDIRSKFKDDLIIKDYNFDDRPAIVLSNTKKKKVDVIIYGHIDVVPGSKEQFIPQIKGTRLYGRGTYDMKAVVSASLCAVRDYVKNNGAKTMAVFIVSDEELDGQATGRLLSKVGYKAKFAVVPDGGSETDIVLQQKGFLQLKVTIRGKGAHASRPWDCDNPITKSATLHTHLLSKFPSPDKKDQWKTSITLTKVVTDNGVNQIPEIATAYFDVRYVKKEHIKEVVKEIKKYLGKSSKVEIIAENNIFSVDQNNPYVQTLAKSLQNANKKKIRFVNENSTSDAIFFTENGIPAVLFRPKGGNPHRDNEWVDINSVYRSYESLRNFLVNFPL